jgi:hypothetical protein
MDSREEVRVEVRGSAKTTRTSSPGPIVKCGSAGALQAPLRSAETCGHTASTPHYRPGPARREVRDILNDTVMDGAA